MPTAITVLLPNVDDATFAKAAIAAEGAAVSGDIPTVSDKGAAPMTGEVAGHG